MKIRTVFSGILLLCGILFLLSSCGVAQSSKENKDMAKENKEATVEGIKNFITHMKSELEIDADRFPSLILEIEDKITRTSDRTLQAIMHSMAAEMYQNYAFQNHWNIRQRTSVVGYMPADIREWSQNIFDEKIKEHLSLSLQPASLLQQTPIALYAEIVNTGKDAAALQPSLYDFLAQRAIEIKPSDEIYKEWIAFRRSENNPKATLLVELDYLSFRFTNKWDEPSYKAYEKELNDLYEQYKNEDFSTEIQIARIELMDNNRFETENRDSLLALQYNLSKETIQRFPHYERIGILKNKVAAWEEPTLTSQTPQAVYPGQNMMINITYRNLPGLKIELNESSLKPIDLTPYQDTEKLSPGKLVKEEQVSFPAIPAYLTKDTVVQIPVNGTGIYECVISSPNGKIVTRHYINASRLAAVSRNSSSDGSTREVLVTDFLTGKPIGGATVTWFGGKRREYKPIGQEKTDKDGIASIPAGNETLAYQASLPDDEGTRLSLIYPEYVPETETKINTEVSLFTDRGIYRPGQNIFYKGIAYQLTGDNPKVMPNQSYTVVFRDANYKEITTRTVKTNEFGSFNGEFTIPKQLMTGSFSLSVENASVYVRVEEYKRPTFSAEIDPVREEIAFGDLVTLKGKAETFSGVALQEGKVVWRIIRRPFWPRIGYGILREEQVAEGESTVNTDGTFSLSFRPEKPEGTAFPRQYYSYDLIATVTDSKGETQETRFSFPVGDTSIILSTDMKNQFDKNDAKITVSARLLNGEEAKAEGNFQIIELTGEKQIDESVSYKEAGTVYNGRFTSGKQIPAFVFSSLPSGIYRIILEAKDSKGREVKAKQDFVLYSKTDKRPPIETHSWLIVEKDNCLPGESAKWIFGTSDEEAYILFEIFQNNKRLSRERFVMNNENRTFTLPFKESYGDGITATFTFIKKGELYVTRVPIRKTQPDRKLTIRPETFRDRLLPGSSETWKFRITDKDSLAVKAEVLAGMYDSSLDAIMPFEWYFSPERTIYLQIPSFIMGDGYGRTYQHSAYNLNPETVPAYTFSSLDWQNAMPAFYGYTNTRSMTGSGVMRMAKSADPATRMDMLQEQPVTSADTEMIETSADDGSSMRERGQSEENRTPVNPLRTNFNETAFFFPSLLTNEKGDLIISFTLPESNTTWKLQTIAHTKEMKYGKMTQEIISSKPLMVIPSLPRFLREGDKVNISAQIVNQQEKILAGDVRVEWFDPVTNQPVTGLRSDSKSFSLGAKGQTAVKWEINVPSGTELIGCRIIAETPEGSDGEQHMIPVLSNRILVTESTPFYLSDQNEKNINITPGANPYRLTLEVSANPVWYAVQALSTMTTPTKDDVVSWFASYYTNTIAGSIAASQPRIQQVISQWTAQGGDASTLHSNLENNEELKNILLEETPWVLTAETETEQKQRLALLFDINRAKDQRETAMRHIIEQQREDGGWGWFKGFYSDRAITLSILKGMSQLVQLSAAQYNQEEKEMQMRALLFLDKTMQKDYESLRKYNKDWEKTVPSAQQMEFLFVRSGYRDIPEWGDAREAIRFYTDQAEKNWEKLNLYGKGQAAILMHRNGKKEVAQSILAWLRKTATTSEEQGMYWANNRRGNSFYTSPIDVHTLLMSAFEEVSPDVRETNRMKQWLLNQKRTQNWESTPSTMNAIHAILLTGSDWLNENNTVTVQWGNKTYSTTEGETATGYLKETISTPEITPSYSNLTIRKEGNTPAWGAVYNQYFAPVDRVNDQKGVLNVEKKLFVETNNGQERQIRPVTENEPMRIGDKVIVRLTIRNDREMNYVYLKDLRAGCFEPAQVLSGSSYQDGVWYYRAPKDVSENFYFERLPQGTFVIEYPVYVSRSGDYAGGISTIQCMYAPEFVSHTEGNRVVVNE